jgi:cytochrome o ubiquinol oxidase operon protein cyoD
MSKLKHEQDPTKSYFIGFFLSLLFTAIPYYLVTNKTVSGTALLATILSIAVIQMAIQVFFFLHLGRGPKPLYNVTFFVGTVGLIVVVVVGSIFIMNNLHYNMAPSEVTQKLAQDESIPQINGEDTGACQVVNIHHEVTISKGVITPTHTDAKRCDALTFINEDDKAYDFAFGKYPAAQNYGGESKLSVRAGYGKTMTLNQQGSYDFYDQLDPLTSGSFTVNP